MKLRDLFGGESTSVSEEYESEHEQMRRVEEAEAKAGLFQEWYCSRDQDE